MRLVAPLLGLLLCTPLASAQGATQDIRLRLVSNDATDGGIITIAIDVKVSPDRSPNTSFGSATIDVVYDAAHLSPAPGATNAFGEGYTTSLSVVTCSGTTDTCARFGVTGGGVGPGSGFDPAVPGLPVGTASYTQIATINFTLDATSAAQTSFLIHRPTLSVGYFATQDNSDGSGTIHDNVVGNVPFETAEDLSIRTASLNSGANWYLVGMPGSGATLDDLASSMWTQGFTGSDAGTNGSPNVVFWNETTGAYAAPGAQTDAVAPGAGLFLYAFADDNNDGSDDPFPKTATLATNPVNDQGSPVNATTPNPYLPTLPFTFSTTFTAESAAPDGDGWNLLSNPTDDNADWDDAGWIRTNLSTALYTWNGTAYRTWTPGVGGDRGHGVLAPFEGFWTEAMAASPVLTMPADAYGASVPPAREAAVPTVRLRVAGEVDGLALEDEAFVAFLDGADAGRDIYDAHELLGFTDTQLHLFTELETGETFTTDVRPPLDKSDVKVALDVAALASSTSEATLTLTWPELRGLTSDIPVQLLDIDAETIIDLWTETEYTFSLSSTASRTAESKEASGDVLALRGPQTLRTVASRSARRADTGRFILFVGSEAQMPVSSVSEEAPVFDLAAPAPNPAQRSTRLRYSLAEAGDAHLAIYDMLGRSVTLAASGLHQPGRHEVTLDTGALAPGLYVIRLETEGQSATQSLTVVR